MTGVIIKSLAGFYYVRSGGRTLECRARGRFRLDGTAPLVGDRVELQETEEGRGVIMTLLPRRNSFVRPAVSNTDLLVVMASAVNPVTDPYLIDRVAAIAQSVGCGVVICINKVDMDEGDKLFEIYSKTPYCVIRVSAETKEGVDELRRAISGKICAFTGNSGVGKSSILNALDPSLGLPVGEVSDKLGRGRHTTRHVELFALDSETYIADTPGFASFDMDMMAPLRKEELQFAFPEFEPFIGKCRFSDCAHLKEPGCAVIEAAESFVIHPSRHESYKKLYELAALKKDWENK